MSELNPTSPILSQWREMSPNQNHLLASKQDGHRPLLLPLHPRVDRYNLMGRERESESESEGESERERERERKRKRKRERDMCF